MAIFRRKSKLQLTGIRAMASRAVYQQRDFPTIDITVTVADDEAARKSDLTEVTLSLTLWEASQLATNLNNSVQAATGISMPKRTAHGLYAEGA